MSTATALAQTLAQTLAQARADWLAGDTAAWARYADCVAKLDAGSLAADAAPASLAARRRPLRSTARTPRGLA